MPINGHKRNRMRDLSGLSLSLAVTLVLATVGCGKVGQLAAMKNFKAANQAYTQQEYKTAAELYEQTVQADPETWPRRISTSETATTTSSSRARRARRPTTSS